MPTLVYRPASQQNSVEVRQAGTIYEFDPGVPKFVPAEHLSAVKATLQALGGNMTSPTPTVVQQTGAVAGTTTYSYEIVSNNDNGDTLPGTVTSLTTGNASLTAPSGNVISWAAAVGAKNYKVVRTAGGATQGLIATTAVGSPLTFQDNGAVASVYTAAGAAVGQTSVVNGPSEE